jgi:hypothetical protein
VARFRFIAAYHHARISGAERICYREIEKAVPHWERLEGIGKHWRDSRTGGRDSHSPELDALPGDTLARIRRCENSSATPVPLESPFLDSAGLSARLQYN